MQRILVSGATGFTGRHVIPLLLKLNKETTCFVRPTSNPSAIALPGLRFAEGDLDDQESVERALKGKEALINIANLTGTGSCLGERAAGLVRACEKTGVRRAIFVSSTSIFTTLRAPAKAAKLAAEKAILESDTDFTILRPTMIYGTEGDRNIIRLVQFLRRSPLIVIPGNGEFRQQPIHVEDLARAIVDSLESDTTIGKTYNLAGAYALSFNQMIEETCLALGVKRLKLHLPIGITLLSIKLLNRLAGKSLLKEEQILRMNEDKAFEYIDAQNDFGFTPRSYSEGIRKEVAQL